MPLVHRSPTAPRELGLSGRARECAAVALDALHAALGDAAEKTLSLPQADARVAVAMSGGVDSAVALLRERAAGARRASA